jgi:hypothetical protein
MKMIEYKIRTLKKIQEFLKESLDYDYLCNLLPEDATEEDLEYVAEKEALYSDICDLFTEHIARGGWRDL